MKKTIITYRITILLLGVIALYALIELSAARQAASVSAARIRHQCYIIEKQRATAKLYADMLHVVNDTNHVALSATNTQARQ